MDSPDRDLTISAAEVQGSPLFNFLCSLSPIKPLKSVHVVQGFSDLTFPPPPAVFVSPKSDPQDSSSSQRNQYTSKAELEQTRAGSSQVIGHSERKKLLPSITERLHNLEGAVKHKNVQEKDQPTTSSSSNLADYVEEYLHEPGEREVDVAGSSSESLALITCRSKPPILDSDSENRVSIAGAGARKLNKCEKASSSNVSSDVLESHGSDVAEEPKIVEVNVLQSTLEPDASSAGCHEGSDYSFLLPSGVDKLPAHGCADDWQSQLSSLSDLSVPGMAKYLATLKEIISEGAPDAGTDALCSQVSNVCTAEYKADVHGMIDQEIDNAVKNDKQEGTGFKANTLPLRGVRRRCLDFELQEGPERSETSVLSLKSHHANENIRSQNSPLCSKKIPESLLRERASATSGATNSEPNLGMDICIQPCTSIDGKPTTKVVLTGSSMLKLSSCFSLKDSQCKATKSENQLVCARRVSGTSPVGRPSGIGLHLNSLTGGTPILQSLRETEGASSKSILPVTSTLQQDLEENCKNHLPVASSDNNSPYQTGTKSRKELLVSLVEKTSMGECEVHWEGPDRLVSATKSVTCFRTVTLGIKQADNILPSCRVEKKPSPLGRKRVLLPDLPHQLDPDGVEDSSQSPPSPKKRRKSNSTVEKGEDGCKRCNCKKSKCLKLYCDCFAAGVYCVDSCTCQGCLNKPEFEETVLGTRQQIESRNPLAFAPKIVRGADPSTNGDDCGETPASARHKRGCNCKRSQCLKKYCECYQAGVGCSDGCRCEGCKNLYGRKEALEESEDRDSQVERVDEQLVVDEMDMRDFGTEEQRDDLTPITPFQNSGPSRSTLKSRTATRRRFSSEVLPSSGKPSGSPSRLLRSSKGMQSSNPVVSMPTQLPNSAASPVSTPKMLKIGEFSPRWDGLGNICTLTPLPQPPLRPTPASVSAFDGIDCSPPSFSQQKGDQARSSTGSARHSSKLSQCPSLQASVRLMNNHQVQTSANVQNTPSTPGFTSFSDSNPHNEDSGDILPEFVGSAEDDSTPEFLKDPVSGSSPIRLLKTSSPKQKRVSPPHHQIAREPSRRGLPSPGLRSGRKIILQAVPSVPHTPFSTCHEQMTRR